MRSPEKLAMNGGVVCGKRAHGLLATGVLLLLVLGCKSLDLKAPSWMPADENTPVTPATVSAIWSPAVMTRADGTQARGFGGRLMFYRDDKQKPVKVDGSLVVFAYDEQKAGTPNPEPDRKYVFTREQLASHYSKSKLGHSYSIWIPWDGVNGPTRKVSMLVRFNPADGSAITGDLARLSLIGVSDTELALPSTTVTKSTVEPVSLQSPVESERQRQATTATIRIPSYKQQR